MRDDRGQTTLLVTGLVLVALLLVCVVVDASAAYLRRQELDGVADGAALAAADGINAERMYVEGVGEHTAMDPSAARRLVDAHLRRLGVAQGLRWQVVTTDGRVEVQVTGELSLPLVPPGWSAGTQVTGTASVQVVILD